MRAAGILLPVFSLPGKYGIGDFSNEAYSFIDKLSAAGQRYWQILPLNPVGDDNCPYQAVSCMGGEPMYISPEKLCGKGLISEDDLATLSDEVTYGCRNSQNVGDASMSSAGDAAMLTPSNARAHLIDYDVVKPARMAMLQKAFVNFRPNAEYYDFCDKNSYWLDDYASYRSEFDTGEVLTDFNNDSGHDLDFHKWTQYEFFSEWNDILEYAHSNGVEIIGDMPYYVSYDSVDVKTHPELFMLDADGKMKFVSGAPADAFTPDGQCWNDPVYDWDENRRQGFDWWMKRLRQNMSMYDVIRIDHMRGFESYYAIPAETRDPFDGHWEKGPGVEFFDAAKREVEGLRIIAEDLGFLTDEVHDLIRDTGYPGMKVLEFAFDSDESNDYLPFNYDTDNCVVYTGTHDNDTARGWYEKAEGWKKDFVTWYIRENTEFGETYDESRRTDPFSDALVELAYSTRAETCIIPMQDHLGLGSEARINVPGVAKGNWGWHMEEGAFTDELVHKIRLLTEKYGR